MPAALNAEEEEIGRRGEESLVGRDVLGTPNDNGSVIDATLPPRIPPRLRASQNSALKDAFRRPPVSLSSARSRPARSSRNVLLLQANESREAASSLAGRSGGQSREEFFAGRRAWRRAGEVEKWKSGKVPQRTFQLFNCSTFQLARSASAGAREKARSGLLPAASRSGYGAYSTRKTNPLPPAIPQDGVPTAPPIKGVGEESGC